MFPDWFAATGFVTVFRGFVGALTSWCNPSGNGPLPPWEAYHRALCRAQVTRGRFLRDGFLAIAKSLRDRICCQAQKWHIRLCPLCC